MKTSTYRVVGGFDYHFYRPDTIVTIVKVNPSGTVEVRSQREKPFSDEYGFLQTVHPEDLRLIDEDEDDLYV